MTVHITPGMPESLSPDTVAVHPYQALRDALINKVGSLLGSDNLSDRSAIKVPYVAEEENLDWVEEGAEIPETKTTIQQLTVPSRKIATLKTISNEAARNTNGQITHNLLIEQSTRSIIAKADAAVFGTTNDKELTGLGALEGTTDAGTLSGNLDPFVDAVATIAAEGGDEANIRIVCHPKAWATIAKLKDTKTGNRPLVDTISATSPFLIPNTAGIPNADGTTNLAGTTENVRTLNGIPLFMSRHVPENSIIMLDSPNLGVGASPIRIDMSDQYAFNRDSISLRATYRIGWKVFNPKRIVKITTA